MANFLSLNANKVSIVDNQSHHSIHVYVMHAWKIIPILFTFQHFVEGGNANDLITMIVQSLMQQRGLLLKKHPQGSFVLVPIAPSFCKVATLE
jgi:hypothetical protein